LSPGVELNFTDDVMLMNPKTLKAYSNDVTINSIKPIKVF